MQHLVIKAQIIEAHHQVRALQFPDKIVHLRFTVDFVFTARRAERHAHAHAHLGNVAPAAHLVGGFLRLKIEINDVFCHKF